jgi:hypothetical protein
MVTYTDLKMNRRKLLALTGLTQEEFQRLSAAFRRSYARRYPADRTVEGQPRQRFAGGGRTGSLHGPEQKLLFLLIYLKTYPQQVLLAELFGLSQSQANHWIHRLLPILRSALDDLGVLPEREPAHFARAHRASEDGPRLIIDATERRRQRPKSPEKQAAHYSGRKKAHTDKNVVVVSVPGRRVGYLSRTYPGTTHEKKIAEGEAIRYPREAELYKDSAFAGYEPLVRRTYQPKKKGGREGIDARREAE